MEPEAQAREAVGFPHSHYSVYLALLSEFILVNNPDCLRRVAGSGGAALKVRRVLAVPRCVVPVRLVREEWPCPRRAEHPLRAAFRRIALSAFYTCTLTRTVPPLLLTALCSCKTRYRFAFTT